MSVVQISVIVASILTGEWKWCQERAYVRGGGGGWLHGDGVPVWLLWAAVIWQEGRKEGRKEGSQAAVGGRQWFTASVQQQTGRQVAASGVTVSLCKERGTRESSSDKQRVSESVSQSFVSSILVALHSWVRPLARSMSDDQFR